jgi:serine/threonine-protein kinase HipA
VSLAGLQFKISARLGRRGIALPAEDQEGDWILKFADQRFSTLPTNEYVTMTWGRTAGLNVPEIRLVRTDSIPGIERFGPAVGELAFAIKRYDRTESGRIHQEDFAQALGLPPGDAKYEATNMDTIVRVVAALAPEDLDELASRIAFNILCGNDDAHAKNWSLWYPVPTQARLSPAYDLVSTVEYFPENDMSLKLGRARKFGEVGRDRVKVLANRTGIDPNHLDEVVVDAVRRQVAAWTDVRERDEVTSDFRELIDTRLQGLRLVRECR